MRKREHTLSLTRRTWPGRTACLPMTLRTWSWLCRGFPLATLDHKLKDAAKAIGVPLYT